MRRVITGFRKDEEGDWVALLSCLHGQHVRHRPPFFDRPWVESEAGRRERLGTGLECPLCDRAEMPGGLHLLRVMGPFDEATAPRGLRRDHELPEGRWALLRVLEGSVGFSVSVTPPIERVVEAGESQVIVPGVPHSLDVAEPVQFVVELFGPG
jgi:tellurite resistance-related uncharacterized protein